jgi:N utilization substance protein A
MKSDFMLAINQLCTERKLSREVVLEAVEAALISAYKRNFGSGTNIEARIETNTGEVRIYAIKEVVDEVQDRKLQISLPEAREVNPEAQIGESVMIESTPRDFGRIAAQTAKQVILQRIREAERDVLFSSLADKAGEIAHGSVQSVEYHTGDIIVNIDGAEALLPAREQVAGERYRRGARVRAYVLEVRKGSRGPQITLSRRSPAFLGRLLELEVPEIFNGAVEIKAIAREAGSRSKVAVRATQEGVDPVGSCVGVRGGRIQNVVNELNGEKIDVVQWDSEVAAFIANSLSPAQVMNVRLEDSPEFGKTATVIVPDRQLSLAIGKEGQNARLAAKLTGWRIDIKSATETAEETLGRFEQPALSPDEMDLLSLAEAILREHPAGGFSETERSMIDSALDRGEAVDLPWPGAPGVPAPAAREPQSPTVQPQAEGMEAAAVQAQVEEKQAGAAEGEAVPAGARPAAVEAAAQAAERTGTAAAGGVPVAADELPPPFEGEIVEDSIGWVVTEPAPEFKYDWEAQEAVYPAEWEEEEVEEEEATKAPKKKKRKKGRQGYGQEDDIGLWQPRGGKPRR